jgi:hypothetical protein
MDSRKLSLSDLVTTFKERAHYYESERARDRADTCMDCAMDLEATLAQRAQPEDGKPTRRQMLQAIIADEVMERVAKPLGLEHLPPFDAETADAVIEYLDSQ